jgi:glycerophosphoryl diester phosphodiesterase
MVIAFHDFYLDDLTDGKGKICELTLHEVQKYNLKNSNRTDLSDSRIATLSEIFAKFPHQLFALDLHENNKVLIEKVIEVVTKHNMAKQVVIVSTAKGLIHDFQRIEPDWTFVASPGETKKFIIASKLFLDSFVSLTTDIVFLPYRLGQIKILNSRMVERLHKRGKKVWSSNNYKPYENVNSIANLMSLKSLGVDGVYTDNPKFDNQ